MEVCVMRWQDIKNEREKYAAYLASREWSVLKEAVRRRSRGFCERCVINVMDHVHHLTYARKYAEHLEDLQSICKPCHDYTHAKSDTDPAAWPLLFRRVISSVYLAGKMGTTWRDTLMERAWSEENNGAVRWIGNGEPGDRTWDTARREVVVPGRYPIDFTGPYWIPREIACGHDSVNGQFGADAESPRTHAAGWDEHAYVVARNCSAAIKSADLIFAWIDSADAYGTLVEIGMAVSADPDKVVVVAVDASLGTKVVRDLWFAMAASAFITPGGCGAGIVAHSAKQAWDWIWENARLSENYLGPTVVLDQDGEPTRTGRSWDHGFWHLGNPDLKPCDAYMPVDRHSKECPE
jgi:hypothetical protein